MTATSKLDYKRILPIFVLTFVDVLGLTIVIPILHLYAAVFGASPLEIGLVAATFPIAQLIGVPLMGALSDRYGRKPLLLISQVTTFIGFLLLASANSLWMVIFSRALDGLFGANIATAQAAISDVTDDSTRAQGLGLIGAAFGIGFILGPVISFFALEFSDSLAIPALIAAAYSFVSILLTLFLFRETLPAERRGSGAGQRPLGLLALRPLFSNRQIALLIALLFGQQVIFFGFESLLGLFTLSRLGFLGQGNALLFIFVGALLITVQVRYLGRWTRRYGERRVIFAALSLLTIGLLLFGTTPEQPHPLYLRQRVINQLRDLAPTSTEAIIGDIAVELPLDENRGIGGLLWVLVAIVPIAIGAGLVRPSINSLLTRHAGSRDFGRVLGASAAAVSGANALAPLIGGLLFQRAGPATPFLLGGMVMALLTVIAVATVRDPLPKPASAEPMAEQTTAPS